MTTPSKIIEERVKEFKETWDFVVRNGPFPGSAEYEGLFKAIGFALTQVQEETLERVREIIEHGGTGHTVLVIRPDEYDGRPFIDERQLLEALKSLSHPTSSDVTNTRK